MRKQVLPAIAAVLAIANGTAVLAQGDPPKPAAETPVSPEELANIQRASRIFEIFNEAFHSKAVDAPVKGVLLGCVYNNKMSTISAAAKKVLDGNPTLNARDGTTLYRVAASVCGVTFPDGLAPPATPKPAPGSGDTR